MFLMDLYLNQEVIKMRKINGAKFDNLLKRFNIQNQILSEYLECNRTTIISRRKVGVHDFSNSQYEKLDDLFTYGSDYNLDDFIELVFEDRVEVTDTMINHVRESLKISRKIKEYQRYLITYRYLRNFSNPVVVLPQNRNKHLDLIDRLMESTANVEYVDRELNKRYDYFLTSDKFLTGIMNLQQGYILSVQVKYRNQYQKTDPNKLINFSINRIRLNELPISDIDTYYNEINLDDDLYSGVSLDLDKELSESYNKLKSITNIETRFDDFIDLLYSFNNLANKHIVMYLDDSDDEFDYMMSNLDARRRDKLRKINIYKMNNMFGKRGGTFLSIEEALKLYNITFNSERLLLDPLYRNVATNALINKQCLNYGGGNEERMKKMINSRIHISGKDKEGNNFSKYSTLMKNVTGNMNEFEKELNKRLKSDISEHERIRILKRKERMKSVLDLSPFDIPSPEVRDKNIEKRRKLKMKGVKKNG